MNRFRYAFSLLISIALGLFLTGGTGSSRISFFEPDFVRAAEPYLQRVMALPKPPQHQTKNPIDRSAGPVRLGMTVEEFQAAVGNTEQTKMNPGLIKDERSFEVKKGSLPEGVRSIGCRFLNDRLYRITVDYREGFFDEHRWDEVINQKMERYGEVPIRARRLSKYPTETIEWDDPETRLVIQREQRLRIESRKMVTRYNVLMVLLDQATWQERSEIKGPIF